jgi:hypothetical protein
MEAGLTYWECGATIGPETASAPTAAVPWSEWTDSDVDSSLTNSHSLVGGSV